MKFHEKKKKKKVGALDEGILIKQIHLNDKEKIRTC